MDKAQAKKDEAIRKAKEKVDSLRSEIEAQLSVIGSGYQADTVDAVRKEFEEIDPLDVDDPAQAKKKLQGLLARLRKIENRPRFLSGKLDAICERMTEIPPKIPTGFFDLDAMTGGGLAPGITILGGRNQGGKTTMAQMIAESAACAGHTVLFVSFEETEESLVLHALARWSDVHEGRIPGLEAGLDKDKVDKAKEEIKRRFGGRLVYYDAVQDHVSPTEILDMIEGLHRDGDKVPVVVVDHLQLLAEHEEALQPAGRGRRDLRQVVNGVMREFIEATRRGKGICVVLISQLNRGGYRDGADKLTRDSLADFRESAAIESAADLAFTLKPGEEEEEGFDWKKPRSIYVHVAKNRRGPGGKYCVLTLDGPTHKLSSSDLDGKADPKGKGWRAGESVPADYRARCKRPPKPPKGRNGKGTGGTIEQKNKVEFI